MANQETVYGKLVTNRNRFLQENINGAYRRAAYDLADVMKHTYRNKLSQNREGDIRPVHFDNENSFESKDGVVKLTFRSVDMRANLHVDKLWKTLFEGTRVKVNVVPHRGEYRETMAPGGEDPVYHLIELTFPKAETDEAHAKNLLALDEVTKKIKKIANLGDERIKKPDGNHIGKEFAKAHRKELRAIREGSQKTRS
jgi:hypothetical protein